MPDKERPRDDPGGSEGLAGEGGGDDGNEPEEEKSKGGGEKVSLFRSWKGKNLRNRKRKKRKGVFVNSVCRGRSVGSGDRCCLCLNRPRTRYDSDESPTSDPNSPEFTFDMLRGLIENNDFVSKECNPHLDAEDK